jgi:hypothetical protein
MDRAHSYVLEIIGVSSKFLNTIPDFFAISVNLPDDRRIIFNKEPPVATGQEPKDREGTNERTRNT